MPAVNTYIISMRVAPHLWARQCQLTLLIPAGKGVTRDNEQKRMIPTGTRKRKKREADDIYYVILTRWFPIGNSIKADVNIFSVLHWSHFSHIPIYVVCLLSFYIRKNARLTLPSIIAEQPLAFIIHTKYSIKA